ncbi:MAG: beta galactosidase jelly roll domain-containing protein [Chitinispirillaceae bacterium]|nr:beta galactosidase jelly roll domain-containing protein [Chitinispirillaceae bacterium]
MSADTDYWVKNFTTSKKFEYHLRRSFNNDWRFLQGSGTGTPSNADFNDDGWEKVAVPHSPSYEAPEKSDFYLGVSWYRKKFMLPSGLATDKKIFIEFGGAMSTARVWVNGVEAGSHETNGYTSFVIDITKQISRTDSNVIAVRVDNSPQADVPPGAGWIDYVTWGGIYRNTWLHVTDPVYIPQWGQIISTPTVSSASATVNVRTTVVNDKAQASSCTVTYEIFNKDSARVSTQTAQQTIPANSSSIVSMSSEIPTPVLWSPESPTLYRVVTTVSVDGIPVDDYVDRFGVRTLEWTVNDGFHLNGSRCFINGANLAQDFAWVHAAVPVSRFYKMIESVKYAGFNLMRCSHFPRDPAFYDACDELGLLLLVEVPTWGWSHTSYTPVFWSNLHGTFKEMVLQGNNHPSIIGYGYFNEPYADFSSHYTEMKKIADSINPLLPKYITSNGIHDYNLGSIDFYGNQYSGYPNNLPALCTEYLGFSGASRGDQANEDKYATDALGQFEGIRNDTRNAGGVLWTFRDYWGFGDGGGRNTLHDSKLGIVDQYFIPKRAYYAFRKTVLSVSDDDNPVQGTATKVSLEPDLTYLRADGSDISRIIVAIRDGSGKCINSNASVNLVFSGSSCTMFGPTTVNAIAGKVGVVVRSTQSVGATTISATSNNLEGSSVTITTYPAVDNATSRKSADAPKVVPVVRKTPDPRLVLSVNGADRLTAKGGKVVLYDLKGQRIPSSVHSLTGSPGKGNRSPGVYVLKIIPIEK